MSPRMRILIFAIIWLSILVFWNYRIEIQLPDGLRYLDPSITPPAMMVQISDGYCPSLEVTAGNTVSWTNVGNDVHILRSELKAGHRMFDLGPIENGSGFLIRFDEPGVIHYQCSEDGSLAGVITVVPQPSR